MAKIDPAPEWADIPQLEQSERMLAGEGGPLNAQAVALAKRVAWLRKAFRHVSPFMFSGVGDGVADDTTAVRAAITAAIEAKIGVDLRGGEWRISGTLDFTQLKSLTSDQTSIIRVNPVGFASTKADPWAILFGDPDTDRTQNRCVYTSVVGYLVVVADNRTSPLNGIFIKGNFLSFGSIRANGFNGTGVERAAVYDSYFESISVELCGNVQKYAYRSHGFGDTTNASNVARLQVERAYHRAFSLECIRSVYQNIHCERTAILTLDDGTTGLASGLTYTNIRIDIGNSSIMQMVVDCLSSGAAPDGQALAAFVTSMNVNLDFSSIRDVTAADAFLSTTRGRCSEYAQIAAANWNWGGGASVAYGNTVLNPRISGTMRPGARLNVIGGTLAAVAPSFNASDLVLKGVDIDALTFPSTILGDITLENCRFPASMSLGACGSPQGFTTANGSIGETKAPVTFRDCTFLGTVVGSANSRAVFDGGYVATVALASGAQFELRGVKGQAFGHAGTPAYVTRDCRFTTANQWAIPAAGRYPIGTITERIGAGTGRMFFSAANDAATWTQIA